MAKETQPLMMVDLEQGQGVKVSGLTDNEPAELILDRTKENETGSGNFGRWSEGFHYPLAPKHGTAQKANVVSAKSAKPIEPEKDSCSESVIPGFWPTSFDSKNCCIYRVPNRLRRMNPEAYTPQMLLIGPLHYSKKAEARQLSNTNLRYLEYRNMEVHKKKYLNDIANIYGVQNIEEFRSIIEAYEQVIRKSYAESTDWITSEEFVDMILHDSVFILRFFMLIDSTSINKNEDILFKEPCFQTTIVEDLMLLENQLPYAILHKLFEPFLSKIDKKTFRELALQAFSLEDKIKEETDFRHFTDLDRRVRVETLIGLTNEQKSRAKTHCIDSLYNADKLDSAGVAFENVAKEKEFSLMITFEGGILKMPCFTADDNTERVMRNLMALEQCHYPLTAYVCNYMSFLDYLIDTENDVDLLVKQGVIKNWLGHQGLVAKLVNKLCLGVVIFGSQYYDVAERLEEHYNSSLNKSCATLRRVYFKDLWTGTATVAAVVILVFTLIGTVASVIQVKQNEDKSPTPSPPGP